MYTEKTTTKRMPGAVKAVVLQAEGDAIKPMLDELAGIIAKTFAPSPTDWLVLGGKPKTEPGDQD